VRKVLIASRGEIAVRIARACRDTGLVSVAVYAPADREARHVQVADQAVPLAGVTPAQTYLDIPVLLRAAADAGADALHPGYGPLAESAECAQAVLDAGLTWIGPPPAVIRRLADKLSARQAARQAGAPLLAAMTTPASDVAEVAAFAREHGFPLMIKASSGGGGSGVAVARTAAGLPSAYARAVRAAVAAGGRAECFAERYLDRARLVETQCLADTHGHVVVISTRDGSLQRRHQKIVEEAPAPFLPGHVEARLRDISRKILRAAGCVGVATCEFLLAPDGALAFLETNARLSVAHPVSEEVTGLDLIRESFRIAEGEPLGYGDPPARGHALQFRIYAEDPARGFEPSPGIVRDWRPPSGPGVRLDSGAGPGSVVSPAFGTLLAKLIVTGSSRAEALQRARLALRDFEITGVATSLPLYRRLVADEAFAPSDPARPFCVDTAWAESSALPSLGWGLTWLSSAYRLVDDEQGAGRHDDHHAGDRAGHRHTAPQRGERGHQPDADREPDAGLDRARQRLLAGRCPDRVVRGDPVDRAVGEVVHAERPRQDPHAPPRPGLQFRLGGLPGQQGDRDPVGAEDEQEAILDGGADAVRYRVVQGGAEQVPAAVADAEEQRERREHQQPPSHDRADRDTRDQAVNA
jgi:acetyl-CoA/propionyl-CoA carboxylase biotin carboxyl carrier protein